MLYNIIFLDSERLEDLIYLPNPKVGDVVKVGMLTDDELEYWTIVEVFDTTVKVKQQ